MASVNKAIILGNVGKDPEVKVTPSGANVATFSIATSESWTAPDGTKNQKTEWHTIVAWKKLADLAASYIKKGKSIYVEGTISTRSWDDKDGNKRYKTEITARSIQLLGSKNDQPQAVSQATPPVAGSAPVDPGQDSLPF